MDEREWLEPDGLGGFAYGTVSGARTRRYHALRVTATTPPTGRMVLVSGFEAWVETAAGRHALSAQRYQGDVVFPDGATRIESFSAGDASTDGAPPWPRWRFRIDERTTIEQEIFACHGQPITVVTFRLVVVAGATSSSSPRPPSTVESGVSPSRGEPPRAARLVLRPLLAGRDYHHLHHENAVFRFDPEVTGGGTRLLFRPYDGVPATGITTNGAYQHQPCWYRGFSYTEERRRGLDDGEDLASPGSLTFDLARDEALLVFSSGAPPSILARASAGDGEHAASEVASMVSALRRGERARRAAVAGRGSRLERAAPAYLVARGDGQTVIAGYPWFTDWGRDTFISLRGLCLATGRLDEALAMLLQWAGSISQGMLPNRYTDLGERPEYNAVDASLWYVIAAAELMEALEAAGRPPAAEARATLERAVIEILDGYAAGTRFGIRLDDDGLLSAGQPGVALTWMDANFNGWVVTPRIGKPVEVQALWLNALALAVRLLVGPVTGAVDKAPDEKAQYSAYLSGKRAQYNAHLSRGLCAFGPRFLDAATGGLCDVVDVDHRAGTVDRTLRPNQIFAAGGLPLSLLDGAQARGVVDLVERELLTPLGLRTLSPRDPAYCPRYQGDHRARDAAYHQGTVWPWLLGPFVEAWVKSRGATDEARREARRRFLDPLLSRLDDWGLGHLPEIADGDAPHTPRGCPFQAWSVAEALRLDRVVLAVDDDGR